MSKSCYVLTLPLKTETWQEHILEKRFEIARNIYNACLGEILKRNRTMRRDQRWQQALRMKDGDERSNLFKELNKEYNVSEYDLIKYTTPMNQKFKNNFDSTAGQKEAAKAYKTFAKMAYGNAKRVNFQKKGEKYSVEGTMNTSGIRFKDNKLIWKKLQIPVVIKGNDYYTQEALEDKVKYCRIVKRFEKGKTKFYLQLIMKGVPPRKHNNKIANSGKVGIDIGTQTVAITSENEVKLLELAPEIDMMERERRVIQRKMDRQRRANNPNKYNENGTAKKGNRDKWINSKRYLKTKAEYTEICRVIARKRELSHNRLANHIVSLGNDVRVEQMNFQGLQKRSKATTVNEKTGKINSKKRFGKSIGNKAPAMLISIIDQKLKYYGDGIKKIDTFKVKASQYNHFTDEFNQKLLGERWNNLDDMSIQRDLYSAFLIMNTNDKLDEVDRELCIETFDSFKNLHDEEINRLSMNENNLSSMGI